MEGMQVTFPMRLYSTEYILSQGYQTVTQITKDGSILNAEVILEGEAEGDRYYSNKYPIQMFKVDDLSGLK